MMKRMHMKRAGIAVLAAAVTFTGIAAADSAPSAKASGTRAEVAAALSAVSAARTRGDSAAKVAKMRYADDILIVEPGNDPPIRGIAATTTAVKEWMDSLGPGGVKACTYKIVDPVVATAKTFSSFLHMVCKANGTTTKEDMNLRLVYVWEKRPEGWRVVLESVHEGAF